MDVDATDRFQPASIDVEKARGVTVTFLDGYVASFTVEQLRVSCPCANCRDQRAAGSEVWPTATSPTPLCIEDVRTVGAWGLGFLWNDGHDTGIFPFELLRRWQESESG